MNLKGYFENTKGGGVLATADSDGKVDAAVYARPHFMEDGTIAMIMRDRLTHHNLQSNSHAAYLFHEKAVTDQVARRTGHRADRILTQKTVYR